MKMNFFTYLRAVVAEWSLDTGAFEVFAMFHDKSVCEIIVGRVFYRS